jgi:plastocyanin domain-containing protein
MMRLDPGRRLLVLICGLGLSVAGPPVTRAAEGQEVHVAKVGEDGVQRVRIVGGNYYFRPARIVVKVNVPVELLASREAGITPHNFVIQAPEAGVAVEEDLETDVKRIRFTPTAAGKYPFYCGKRLLFLASHRERGMEGVLEVVP